MTFAPHEYPDLRRWGTRTMSVLKSEPNIGRDSDDRQYVVAYDRADPPTPGICCNLFDPSGGVCRLPRDHECDHMTFDVELVVTGGVYVTAIIEPGPPCGE